MNTGPVFIDFTLLRCVWSQVCSDLSRYRWSSWWSRWEGRTTWMPCRTSPLPSTLLTSWVTYGMPASAPRARGPHPHPEPGGPTHTQSQGAPPTPRARGPHPHPEPGGPTHTQSQGAPPTPRARGPHPHPEPGGPTHTWVLKGRSSVWVSQAHSLDS